MWRLRYLRDRNHETDTNIYHLSRVTDFAQPTHFSISFYKFVHQLGIIKILLKITH